MNISFMADSVCKGQAPLQCDGCTDDVPVDWYCITCKANLCMKCKAARLHRNHTVRQWTDVDATTSRDDFSTFCKFHSSLQYGYYCKDCTELSCAECIVEKHSKHSYETVELFSIKIKDELKDIRKTLRSEYLVHTKKSIEDLNKRIEVGTKLCQQNKEKIEKKADVLKQQLSKLEDELLVEQDNHYRKFYDSLQKQIASHSNNEKLIQTKLQCIEGRLDLHSQNKVKFVIACQSPTDISACKPTNLELPPLLGYRDARYTMPKKGECLGSATYEADKLSMSEKDSVITRPTITSTELEKERLSDEEVVINSGRMFSIPISVERRKLTICWRFATESNDIAFSVSMKSNSANPLDTTEIFPSKRYDSHKGPIEGTVTAKEEGICTLLFDNTYSVVTSKKVQYSVWIK